MKELLIDFDFFSVIPGYFLRRIVLCEKNGEALGVCVPKPRFDFQLSKLFVVMKYKSYFI